MVAVEMVENENDVKMGLPMTAKMRIKMLPGNHDRDGSMDDSDGDVVCICNGGWQASGGWWWQKWWRIIMMRKREQTWVR